MRLEYPKCVYMYSPYCWINQFLKRYIRLVLVEVRHMPDTDNVNLIKIELLYCETKKQKMNESLDCMHIIVI